jgi:hypothetical protein
LFNQRFRVRRVQGGRGLRLLAGATTQQQQDRRHALEKFVLMHCEGQGISVLAHGSRALLSVTFAIVIDNSNIEARIQGD